MPLDLIQAITVLASVLAAILAWVAKLRWSNEYAAAKDEIVKAKDAMIDVLNKEIENLREFTSPQLREHYLAQKTGLEERIENLQEQLAQARAELSRKDEQIQSLLPDSQANKAKLEQLEESRRELRKKISGLGEELEKNKLLSQLENAKNNYILGLAALTLFNTQESYPLFEKASASFGSYSISFRQVAELLRKQEDKLIASKEFLNMLLRTLVRESFELIKDYCDASRQASAFTQQPWYQFARMIRECLSHNSKFEFSDDDKKLLPVCWRGKTVITSMHGSYLDLSFFGYAEAWELFCKKYSDVM